MRFASSALHSMKPAAYAISPLASARGLPCSSVISRPRRSWSRIINSYSRRRSLERSLPGRALQEGSAWEAASTASRASAAPPRGTVAINLSVVGSVTSISAPERAATHRPPISARSWIVIWGAVLILIKCHLRVCVAKRGVATVEMAPTRRHYCRDGLEVARLLLSLERSVEGHGTSPVWSYRPPDQPGRFRRLGDRRRPQCHRIARTIRRPRGRSGNRACTRARSQLDRHSAGIRRGTFRGACRQSDSWPRGEALHLYQVRLRMGLTVRDGARDQCSFDSV